MTAAELRSLLLQTADALDAVQRGFDPVRHAQAVDVVRQYREAPPLSGQRGLSLDELLAALAYAQGMLTLVREAAAHGYPGDAARCCRWLANRRLILGWIALRW